MLICIRCGRSSAYDVNFGLEVGAAATVLLNNDIAGVTLAGVSSDEIRYMSAEDAIEQRHVDLDQISLFENLGICFGRKKREFAPKFKQLKDKPERYM